MSEVKCDICVGMEATAKSPAADIRTATKNGFDPAGLELLPKPKGAPNVALARAMWRMFLQQSDGDLYLCTDCMKAANPYLPAEVRVVIAWPVRSPDANPGEKPLAARQTCSATRYGSELRRCESLFFSFEFKGLVEAATSLIALDPGCGDAYAYRSFGLLGESQANGPDGEVQDLYGLLRDYFRSCECDLATEDARVCRLFLRIVFAELINRIGQSGAGAKLRLQKTGSPCRGAFAILEGNFEAAQQLFESAAGEPANSVYAHAGIGLLKVFQSDYAGAHEAFKSAPGEPDCEALAKWIEPRMAGWTEREPERSVGPREIRLLETPKEESEGGRTVRDLIQPVAGAIRTFLKAG